MFLLTRDGFLNHGPMKPFVIYQFEMFTFFVSRTMCSILFFSVNRGKPAFWVFDGGTLKRGTKLVSNYNTDVKGS